jgi:ATP-dependent RNA helicase RhlE
LTNSFSNLRLIEPLLRAVQESGYTTPTPIQEQAIPHLLEGRDLLGCAKTGTGKTAAFALPMLQLLSAGGRRAAPGSVRALILAPTRELAAQVAESFTTYGRGLKLSVAVIFGGVNQRPQVAALHRGVDVLVATPGRLVDLMGQKHARLGAVEILVLDEADHMLDLGFIPDVKRILATLPRKRQTLFFSATMPPPIQKLADGMLSNPIKVFVTPPASTVEEIRQQVHFVDRTSKPTLLAQLLSAPEVERALVFTRTKHGADKVARRLVQGGITAAAIHGNKAQNNRERTLEAFRSGRLHVLVATDIAARGIDVDGITHVVNFDLPNVPETYVHRIGRTGRAGASGIAISLCDREEREFLRDIERLIKRSVPVAGATERVRHPTPGAGPGARAAREARFAGAAVAENGDVERAPHAPREHRAPPHRSPQHPAHSRPAPRRFDGSHAPGSYGGNHRPSAGKHGGHRGGGGPQRGSGGPRPHGGGHAKPHGGASHHAPRPHSKPREERGFGTGV